MPELAFSRAGSPISSPDFRRPDASMPSTLPRFPKLEIRQPLVAADASRVDALGALIILLPESALQKPWPEFVHSERLKKRLPAGKKTLSPTRLDLPNGTTAVLASFKSGATAFELLTLARRCVKQVREARVD